MLWWEKRQRHTNLGRPSHAGDWRRRGRGYVGGERAEGLL